MVSNPNVKNVNAKNFGWTLIKKSYFFNIKVKFPHNFFLAQVNCVQIAFRADTGDIRKIVNFAYTPKILPTINFQCLEQIS